MTSDSAAEADEAIKRPTTRVAPMRKFKYKWKPPEGTTWRGIYRWQDEENQTWKDALAKFAYHVPAFATKAEALDFMTRFCRTGSNREHRNYQHIFTLLTSWDEINRQLLPKIRQYDKTRVLHPSLSDEELRQNIWLQPPPPNDQSLNTAGVLQSLDRRLAVPFHNRISPVSTLNTLKYLFEHMRCGIYVKICGRQLCMFVPFANDHYTNTWGEQIEFDSADGSLEAYYEEKMRAGFRKENILPDVREWWANGNMIDNEKVKSGTDRKYGQVWGDFFLCQLREMLEALCAEREVADCELFINKRDYPHLKVNQQKQRAAEPYGFLYGKDDQDPGQDLDLARHEYRTYTPIASFYVSDRFADLPWPTTEDWEAATGKVYPHTFLHCFEVETDQLHFENEPRDLFTEENFRKFSQVPWEERLPTAFFRGTATGGGTTIETNQRLKIAHLSTIWAKDAYYNGEDNEARAPFLDAALTGWNMRDKKIASKPIKFIDKANFAFKVGRGNFVPIYEQARYKFLIYLEGHCAACRYSFLMRLGSVILKVESRCVAGSMWYFPLLRPYVDHVPVKADMSDLDEKIQWCRDHDAECRQMAMKARWLYDSYCSKEGILDYLQILTHKVARRWVHVPNWWEPARVGSQRPTPAGADRCACRRCEEEKLGVGRMRDSQGKSALDRRTSAEETARKRAKKAIHSPETCQATEAAADEEDAEGTTDHLA